MRWANPVGWNRQHRVGGWHGIVTGVTSHQFSSTVQNFQDYRTRCGQIVVEDCTVRWIRGGWLVRWQRGVGVHVPSHAHGSLRTKKKSARIGYGGLELAQR